MADFHEQHANSDKEKASAAAAASALASAAIAHSHPLQDVNLNHDDVDFMREVPLQNQNSLTALPTPALRTTATTTTITGTNPTTTAKENWVKFDDDVNENEALNENNNNHHLNNNNAIVNKGTSSVDSEKSLQIPPPTTTATTTNTLTSPTPTPTTNGAASSLDGRNKLSPILPPPPQKNHHHQTRSRTPTEVSHQQQQQQRNQEIEKPAATITTTTPGSKQHNGEASSTTSAGTKVEATNKVAEVAPAVLSTESTHVNLNSSGRRPQQLQQQQSHQHQNQQQQQQQLQQHHHQKKTKTNANSQQQPSNNNVSPSSAMTKNSQANATSSSIALPVESAPQMRTIELSTGRIREGFANGDVIVTLLPANTKWPWITPAIFRPELVPEELMAQGLTLTVEEYVHAMETLVNDYRFNVYNICYKRILVCWIFFAFAVLLTLLFSGLQGVALFSLGVGWLFLNAAAIFFCMWIKLRLSRGLEKCLARVNRLLMKHKILLVLDDRGRISCHKVNLCFLYFDPTLCVNFLNEFLEQTEQNGGEAIKAGWEAKLDIDLTDIVIQGSNPVRVSRKQAVAQELFLSYLQRWGKDFLRRRLDWTVQEAGVHETPRHLQSSICPCQYEEEVLRNKIKMHLQSKQCCGINCLGCWL